jgi:hypothetical protein
MRFQRVNLWMTAAIVLSCASAVARGQSTTCAYSAVNGDCALTLDRKNPVAPPTIYVRHGKKVTVTVANPLPFEHLSVDLKAAAEQVPVDQFANAFQSITSVLGGLAVISGPAVAAAAPGTPAPPPCPQPVTATTIKACQKDAKDQFEAALTVNLPVKNANFATWIYVRLCWVRSLFNPLPSSAVTPNDLPPVCTDLPPDQAIPSLPMKEDTLINWKKSFDGGSDVLTKFPSDDVKNKIAALDVEIADAKKAGTITAGEFVTLSANQQALHAALDTATSYQQKMSDLKSRVDAVTFNGEPTSFTISDLKADGTNNVDDKNNLVQTWDLDASNKLARIAGLVKADKYGDKISSLMTSLTDVPAKQAVIEFKIEFMAESHFEISAGILVPFRQYHSFSVASPYTSATGSVGCTASTPTAPSAPTNCPIVQQSLTTAIIPDVSFNILLGHEFVIGRQRAAWMFTIAPGYNPATTTAAFGIGPSFAYRSLVFSPLAVIDRDVKLTGGYQVGESAGTATAPTTTNVWRVSPSFGISLRVPLGGGSK